MSQQIPNYIFQTWKTKTNVDSKRSKYINSIKIHNSNMEHFLYDDSDCDIFVRDKFPRYYKLYNELELPVQKADLWRYLVIYYYGGYYLDIDCKSVKSFRNISNSNKENLLIVEQENPCPFKPLNGFPRNPQYAQYWFGATPRHPAIKNVINRVIKNINNKIDNDKGDKNINDKNINNKTLFLTGPGPWTDGIVDHIKQSGKKDVYIIKPNRFDILSIGIDTDLIHKYKNTPVIHQAAGSWRVKDDNDDNYYYIIFIILVIIMLIILF